MHPPPPANANLYSRIVAGIGDPSRPCMESPQGRLYSYADLDAGTARMANALLALGVKPGDRVAAQVEKSAEAILLYLATLRVGAAWLPLNTTYTLAEMEYFIDDSQPSLLVCAPEKRAALTPIAEPRGVGAIRTLGADGSAGSLLAEVVRCEPVFADVVRAGSDLAAILYTSGTTGRSKGAMISHDNLWSNARTLRYAWRYQPTDVLLHALPIFHIHGLFVAVNLTLVAGASMRLLPRFDPELVFAALPRCNILMGVPTMYVRLLQDARLREAATRHVRLFISGSAPLLADTHRQWRERTGHSILERYGMTETGMNTSNPCEGERVPGTVGPPLPGVELRVVDTVRGELVAEGETGMIEVRGPNVFSGYWRNPEKTRSEFRRDGFFITGDLGRINQRGYVEIVGRGKDLIISGGYNVYPKEVETELDQLPGVQESAVIGLPHVDFGEAVTAVVVAKPSQAAPAETALLAALRQRLAAFKCPKRVLVVAELPRNSMGKVQKNLLREQFAQLYR